MNVQNFIITLRNCLISSKKKKDKQWAVCMRTVEWPTSSHIYVEILSYLDEIVIKYYATWLKQQLKHKIELNNEKYLPFLMNNDENMHRYSQFSTDFSVIMKKEVRQPDEQYGLCSDWLKYKCDYYDWWKIKLVIHCKIPLII